MSASAKRYDIQDELFRSARTIVNRGRDAASGDPVILKVLRDSHPDPALLQSFQREFALLQRLDGIEGVIRPVWLGQLRGRWTMALEDIGGQSVAALLEARPLRVAEFLELASEIASALAELHAAEVVHRDINPANVVLNRSTGQLRIIDLGIATRLPRRRSKFQGTSQIVGTLSHISPEQTGRMNQAVDHRTDLYSLGVSFYQMLTGTLPFDESDPLALIHAHIARTAVPLAERVPGLSEQLSKLVARLMAKAPEDRYQSADSLAADLRECQRQLREQGEIGDFALDQQHVPTRLVLPGRLYGRAAETAQLERSFDRVAEGTTELVLVAGYSGVGKSALVEQLYKPITRRGGFFLSGKFDLLQRDVPYASVIQALRELSRQVLGEPQARLDAWKEALLDALGPNGRVLLDLIPEFEHIIGPQPPAPELSAAEQRNRLVFTITCLFKVFASASHPLTLFLDDLQWVDPGSLRLVEALLGEGEVSHLLVIGAYRDNEVAAGHPLLLAIERLGDEVPVSTIEVLPLGEAPVVDLLADMTRCGREEARELAGLVIDKTNGNPFFVREFLQTLYAEGLLRLDGGRWTWDRKAIRSLEVTDNVVDLVADRIRALGEHAQGVLKRAGMLGAGFDLETLSVVAERPALELWEALWPAVKEGFLLVTSDGEGLGEELDEGTEPADIALRFAHDRIQQATVALDSGQAPEALSWEIGERMAARWPPDQAEPRLFDIVGHLNTGRSQCQGEQARHQLARVNQLAARRARASAAFSAAYSYARTGLELLGEGAVERDYELTMALLSECVESAYQTGAYEEMDRWFDQAVALSRAVVDTAWMQEIKTESFNARGRPLDALSHALDYLSALGIELPRQPDEAAVGAELGRTAEILGDRTVDDLAAAPDIQDPAVQAAVRLICKIYSSAYVANPYLFIVVCLRQFQLVVEHGNSAVSPLAYAVYGLLAAGVVQDVEGGYAFGALSDRMLERPDTKRFEAQARHLFSCHTRMWMEPLEACAEGERKAFRVGLETGELEFGCYGGHVASKYAFFHGQALHTLQPEVEQYTAALKRYRQDIACNSHLPWHQAILNLTGRSGPEPHRLRGPVLDAAAARPALEEANDRMSISNAITAELILCTIFGRFDDAVALGTEGRGFLDAVLSQFNQPLHLFFDALVRLEQTHRVDGEQAAELRTAAEGSLQALRGWARSNPVNFGQKVRLLEAMLLDLEGRDHAARDAFDEAIALAAESSFTLDEALADECASRFHLRRGRSNQARHYLMDARAVYARWGALSKVQALEADNASLVPAEQTGTILSTTSTTAGSQYASGALDVATLVRAAEAISTEVVLSRLLRSMLTVLMENAGAARAVLVLFEDDIARVEAEGSSDGSIEVLQAAPLSDDEGGTRWLPRSLYNYAIRTGETVVARDASSNSRFHSDPYVAARGTRSALCVQLKSQGRATGAIYLENDQVAGAFTDERATLVTLLAGQMAISIDNARLYENLERRVASRTRQLEARNSFIREVFGRYMSDEVVDTLLSSREALKLGGERRPMTIMFTDLRGFTAMCERLTPEAVIRTINNYFAAMTDVVQRYEGSINNIVGDGLMVLFGAPLWRDDHAERAVACALEMQLAIDEVNRINTAEGLPAVTMGAGIHTGEAVVGNIGSEKRAKYSVIGRDVNLAARLEASTSSGEIVISQQTRDATDRPVIVSETRKIHPKGIDEPLSVFVVKGLEGRPDPRLPDPERSRTPLQAERAIVARVVDGKSVSEHALDAMLVSVGSTSVELRLDAPLRAGTMIALETDAGLVYARVIEGGETLVSVITGGDSSALA